MKKAILNWLGLKDVASDIGQCRKYAKEINNLTNRVWKLENPPKPQPVVKKVVVTKKK